jgi:hypothetical protein
MTVRVKIEVPAGQEYGITISRETDSTGELLAKLPPGSSQEVYFWKENRLVIREVPLSEFEGKSQQSERPFSSLEDTVSAVLKNRDSYPN